MSDAKTLRVLIVSQYFWPEPFKISELASELSLAGLDVTVLTSIPNYPDGFVYQEYRKRPEKFTQLGSVKIHRVWQRQRGNSRWQLVLNYLSFLICSSVEAIRLFIRGERYDIVFAAQLSPITSVLPAILFANLTRSRLIFWVFDIWPDSVILNQGWRRAIYWPARLICGLIYKQANLLCITSRGFDKPLKAMGLSPEALFFLPQWAEVQTSSAPRYKMHDDNKVFSSDDRIKVLFTGNIGSAQNFIEVAEGVKLSGLEERYEFVLVGSGRMVSHLKARCDRLNLAGTFRFIGRRPPEELPDMYAEADLLLLPLKGHPVFDLTLPAKLQAYMAVGKPILVMAGGEAKRIVESADCGYTCSENNRHGYGKLLQHCAKLQKTEMQLRGKNALSFAKQHYEKGKIVSGLLAKVVHEV